MKKITICFLIICGWSFAKAQTVTSDPATFTGDDEVTLTIDVSGTPLQNYSSDVYVWTWVVNEDNTYKGPDAPTNVNPAGAGQLPAKLTRSATNPNQYTITMTPSDFYGTAAINIPKLGLLAKGTDWGNGQTPDMYVDVQPPVFESPVLRIFPTEFSAEDVVTIFYDKKLEENTDLSALSDFYLYTTVAGQDASGAALNPNSYVKPINASVKLAARGNGVYSITFIPATFYAIPAGAKITKIIYKVQNADGSLTNPPAGFGNKEQDVRATF